MMPHGCQCVRAYVSDVCAATKAEADRKIITTMCVCEVVVVGSRR